MVYESVARKIWEFKSTLDYVDDWPLMSSPIPVLAIWTAYIVFVLKAGPEYMKSRPAYGLHTVLKLYNLFQVIFSLVQFYLGLELLRPTGYLDITCNEDPATKKKIATFIYIYFLAKLSELADTILFVLRKKQNQVTFLHVYHHSLTLLAVWLTLKFEPVHNTIFLATINSFVHVIMYAYYGLSAFPSLTKYLWWKKYITAMQVIQFVFVIIHAVRNYIYSDCMPSYVLFFTITVNEALFIYLFGEFFVRSYLRKDNKNTKTN
ncbi:elongation of very long chain fatty acids protein 7 [Amyelois transitella]|uniref:elongation of very long chain fatty acids protein 7 n=1 Tax=Amyelois transitella TaxID=680683 RepID=UPI00067DFCEF|nr:elongation of very long chain fatty acids protein 7 [Amyelois transitella]